MPTINQLRIMGRQALKQAGIDSHIIDTDVLLMHVLNIDKNTLLINPDTPVGDDNAKIFHEMLERRRKKTPIQYIIGKCEFMSLEFAVTENVLIPRPDTEILVETILVKEAASAHGLEIGIGSGCISVSLEYHSGHIKMTGVDICAKAIETAGHNQLTINSRPHNFFVSNLFENVPRGTFCFIVSNPPYICSADIDGLEENVKGFEPKIALDGGVDGLEFYRKIVNQAPEYLSPRGRIYFEIGHDQADAVAKILDFAGFVNIKIAKDLAGRDRVVHGERR